MQGSQEPQAGDINCGEEIGKLPFWTRTVYFCLGGSWLLSLFGMDSLLGSNSSVVFDKYRVWTLFTANLFVDNLLFLFIVIYNFNSFLPALENKLSSPLLLLRFLFNGALIQLITVVLQFLFFSPDPESPVFNTVCGVWFCMVFKYCYFNGDRQIKFCCFPWKFRRVFYPYILLGVCIVISFRVPIEMVVGILCGLLQVKIQALTTFPGALLAKIASKLDMSSIRCWISYGSVTECSDYSDRWAYQNLDSFQGLNLVPKTSPDNSTVNDPFAHKQGVRLGDC